MAWEAWTLSGGVQQEHDMQPHQWPASSLMRAAEGYSCRQDTKVSQQQATWHASGTEVV
jgi:hypothetical protein